MSNERVLRITVLGLIREYGFAIPIEAPMFSGIPDVAYQIRTTALSPGGGGWLELKYVEALPKRAPTPIRLPELRPGQVKFIREWTAQGGRADLILRIGEDILAVRGRHIENVARGLAFSQMLALPDTRHWRSFIIGHELIAWL